ncbi:MAG TPA: hypothetical protein VGD43_12270 [Micromonospora sp.]
MKTSTPAAPVSGEPRLAAVASWAVLAASFGLSAATWIAMARLAGFAAKLHLPIIDVTADLAWLMPVAVDGYVVVALVLWMAPVPAKVAAFARINTYAAAGIGVAAQSAYHALAVWSAQPATDREVWRAVLAAIVGALPPAVAGLAVHMRALIRREAHTVTDTADTTEPVKQAPTVPATEPAPAVADPAPYVEPVPVIANPVPPATPEPVPALTEPAPAPVVVEPAPAPVPVEPVQPVRPVSPAPQSALFEPARPPAVVPVAASAFTRHNGTPVAPR